MTFDEPFMPGAYHAEEKRLTQDEEEAPAERMQKENKRIGKAVMDDIEKKTKGVTCGHLDLEPSMTPEQISDEMERRITAAGCTDDCDNCKLDVCAREGGCAFIGEDGTITFM